MPITSVALSRAGLGLPPLEISTDPEAAVYWLAQAPTRWPAEAPVASVVPRPRRHGHDQVGRPVVPAPRSPALELPLLVLVSSASAPELYAARAHLNDVVQQPEYDVTVRLDGQQVRHRAGPSAPTWSAAGDPGGDAHHDRALQAHLRLHLLPAPSIRLPAAGRG